MLLSINIYYQDVCIYLQVNHTRRIGLLCTKAPGLEVTCTRGNPMYDERKFLAEGLRSGFSYMWEECKCSYLDTRHSALGPRRKRAEATLAPAIALLITYISPLKAMHLKWAGQRGSGANIMAISTIALHQCAEHKVPKMARKTSKNSYFFNAIRPCQCIWVALSVVRSEPFPKSGLGLNARWSNLK